MVNFKLSQPAEATGLCTDKLVIVAGAGTGTRITPPTICGTNTGEHSRLFILVIYTYLYMLLYL